MGKDEDDKFLRPSGDKKMKEAWDSLSEINLTPQEKLKEQFKRLGIDEELLAVLLKGAENTSDREASWMAEELRESLNNLPGILSKLLPRSRRK